MKISKEESRSNKIYNKALLRPVNDKSFFLEAGQGNNVNGNVFALLKYIRRNQAFDDYTIYFALESRKQDEARLKFKKYNLDNIRITSFGSDEYRLALATSKYLITDNSFPAYFYKRPEQVYLNTWHGTPLKVLGKTDLRNAVSIANVQANMAKADWLLFPNNFTKNIMMRDFMMEGAYKHKTVIVDYPRNDALLNEEFKDELTARYNLYGKRVIAYMPTWRGTGRKADTEEQIRKTEIAISDITDAMESEDVLFVNLHFLIENQIDVTGYENVRMFPLEYETYDFLAICDMLITDYSSVSIDFAGTGKDIVLYLYDYKKYKSDRGFYHDVTDLPFKKAFTAEELSRAMHSCPKKYQVGNDFRTMETGKSSDALINIMCRGTENSYLIEDYGEKDGIRVAFIESINREDSRNIIGKMHEKSETQGECDEIPWTIMFLNNMHDLTKESLKSYVRDMDFIRISGKLYCSEFEFKILNIYMKYGLLQRRARQILKREFNRQIGQFNISELNVMQCKSAIYRAVVSEFQVAENA